MGTKWCKTVIGGGILLAAAVFPIIFLCQEKENVQHKPGVSPDDSPLYSFVSRHLMSDDGGIHKFAYGFTQAAGYGKKS
ncbi:hypothetical protein P7H20_00290 [Paenibacillus larvae]|nr:hypothetical protein [Paenibacillus larvae]MDT2242836.1 hypothetical protein [Paenibacillus larvae]MDT2273639.1 hypothetical protein [Paenibacillus larvae]MDT2295231.1 hypothetical protein [Paenibacillus larvae]